MFNFNLKRRKPAGPETNCGGLLERRVIIAALLWAASRDNVVLYLALSHPLFINWGMCLEIIFFPCRRAEH